MEKNLPQKTGYYWAATNKRGWCNAIVQVYGDFPFFKVNGYDFYDEKRVTNISEIDRFGERINEKEE